MARLFEKWMHNQQELVSTAKRCSNHMHLPLAAALSAALFLSSTAHAVTLTFDNIATRGALVGPIHVEEGFEVVGTGQSFWPSQFYVHDEARPEWTGSPGLTFLAVGGRIELKRLDGGTFNLQSIDLARGDSNRGLVPVGFTGYLESGRTVHATYLFRDAVAGRLETFDFGDAFQGLTAVVWQQGAEWHQFDNIRVTNSVPEPKSAALAVVGLLMVASVARRSQQKA